MRPQPLICGMVAAVAVALSAATPRAAELDLKHVNNDAEQISAIGECLLKDQEVVLFSNGLLCTPYRTSHLLLDKESPNSPFDFDAEKDCPKKPSGPFDARRLSADVIQRLLNDLKLRVGSSGFRIFGAIFCERMNLIGLKLPSSLVIEKSVLKEGIEIQNLQIDGDLAFDDDLILEEFRINRSHMKGSLFADGSSVQKL